MMHGKFNPDRFCKVIEQILSERDENVEVKVSLITKEEAEKIRKKMNKEKTAESKQKKKKTTG